MSIGYYESIEKLLYAGLGNVGLVDLPSPWTAVTQIEKNRYKLPNTCEFLLVTNNARNVVEPALVFMADLKIEKCVR